MMHTRRHVCYDNEFKIHIIKNNLVYNPSFDMCGEYKLVMSLEVSANNWELNIKKYRAALYHCVWLTEKFPGMDKEQNDGLSMHTPWEYTNSYLRQRRVDSHCITGELYK
jgi:hypothetical protein